jgi:transposase
MNRQYEAGPTGYGLCRGLQKAGYGCVVMAPTTMSNQDAKKRVKTDRIDARFIQLGASSQCRN